jgi:hypothetical protein
MTNTKTDDISPKKTTTKESQTTKTKVDDMLLEMITPKVKEIEEKFSRGEGLTQDDINTLLLKSQYNHINHLDIKLNEVTATVVSLEHKFVNLEHKFVNLEYKFDSTLKEIKNEMESTRKESRNDYKNLELKLDSAIKESKNDYKNLELKFDSTIKELKNEMESTRKESRSDYKALDQKIEVTIQKALNRNMVLMIVVIGAFLTLLKIIDKF